MDETALVSASDVRCDCGLSDPADCGRDFDCQYPHGSRTASLCEDCGGTGSVRVHSHEDYGISYESEECASCWGTGEELPAGAIHVDVCPECGTPKRGHGLDPATHCPCKVPDECAVPAIYVPWETLGQ